MIEKDKMGLKEMFALLAIAIGLKGTDISASIVMLKGLNASWMVIIGSYLFVLPPLIILNSILKKKRTKNFLEIIQISFGKYISFPILFVFFAYILINLAMDSRSYTDQLITMNLPKTPIFALYAIFLFVCMYCAKKGWESLGYLSNMIYPYVFIAIILLLLLIIKEVSFMRIFPLFGPGIGVIIKQSFHSVPTYGEAYAFAFFYPFVKDHKTYTKGIFFTITYCMVIISLFYIGYTLAFDYRSVGKMTYPFSDITRLISIGKVITHVETFFLTFWALCVIIKFAFYFYILSKLFGTIFKIKEFEQTIFPLVVLVLSIGMIPENPIYNIFVVRKSMYIIGTCYYLFLPPILWIILKIKEVRGKG